MEAIKKAIDTALAEAPDLAAKVQILGAIKDYARDQSKRLHTTQDRAAAVDRLNEAQRELDELDARAING